MSAVAGLGLTIVPDEWVGLLGLAPLALGVRGPSTGDAAEPRVREALRELRQDAAMVRVVGSYDRPVEP